MHSSAKTKTTLTAWLLTALLVALPGAVVFSVIRDPVIVGELYAAGLVVSALVAGVRVYRQPTRVQ